MYHEIESKLEEIENMLGQNHPACELVSDIKNMLPASKSAIDGELLYKLFKIERGCDVSIHDCDKVADKLSRADL